MSTTTPTRPDIDALRNFTPVGPQMACFNAAYVRDLVAWIDHLERITTGPCPECAQGKHGNCDGTTWDDATDAPADCPCHATGHGLRGEQ